MALRQQQQIDSQHQLLATKEQRLRFLKSQEVRNAVANAEGERLRRLRERVEAQESKLRRLRALRGQVDLQKTYNVTLSNDLDSIRALFSEKEKELSLAVAKVEALTRQLEDLRRDRRCSISLIAGANGAAQPFPPQASRELEKLRRELMYRNQLSLQQDARLHLQREALQQRQAELRSVDQRIFELQTRLQRKRAANVQTVPQNQNHQLLLQQQMLQHQQQQLAQQQQEPVFNPDAVFQSHLAKQGMTTLKQQLLQKQTAHVAASSSDAQQEHSRSHAGKFLNNLSRDQSRCIRGNVAAVEPYIHTPQKSSTSAYMGAGNMPKHAAATANTNQQNKLIQDLTHVKLSLTHTNPTNHLAANQNVNSANFFSGESDESKLAKKMLSTALAGNAVEALTPKQVDPDGSAHIYAEVGPKKRDLVKEPTASCESSPSTSAGTTSQSSRIPKSVVSNVSVPAVINKLNSVVAEQALSPSTEKLEQEIKTDAMVISEMLAEKNTQQLTVHSVPLTSINKSVATAVSNTTTATAAAAAAPRPNKSKQQQQTPPVFCNLEIPPRKPTSSVAPTSVTSAIPKIISPKVNRVAPSIVAVSDIGVSTSTTSVDRPALPPKPSKMSLTEATSDLQSAATVGMNNNASSTSLPSHKKPIADMLPPSGLQTGIINDNLPIKAKPLTIRKQPLSEQPRLKLLTNTAKPVLQAARKIDVPSASALLVADVVKSAAKDTKDGVVPEPEDNAQYSPSSTQLLPSDNSLATAGSSVDELDRAADNNNTDSEKSSDSLKRRLRNSTNASSSCASGKPKLTRRVSFDPLALLLDASLEGELELVKKTAQQVTNPSAANDEGITALHNAICAGHLDIVKFLVEFGCDVNAHDSDGWTPLHCAASCNNLSMVKFLVESGACLFAATLSDHETPAEKCEEDEEGFDGCSEYLYSIQEKLGILHTGEVYAVFSYEAQNSDELTFGVNERLTILRKADDAENEWWWAKDANDQEGYVPRNLLGLYPRIPQQNSCVRD